MIKGTAIAVASALAYEGVGDAFGQGSRGEPLSRTIGREVGRAGAHGLIGGTASVASGGSFRSGFAAGGFASAAGSIGGYALPQGDDFGSFASNLSASVAAGGVGSVLGGGKFANGAVTGAFSYVFNHAMHPGGVHDGPDGFDMCDYGQCPTGAEMTAAPVVALGAVIAVGGAVVGGAEVLIAAGVRAVWTPLRTAIAGGVTYVGDAVFIARASLGSGNFGLPARSMAETMRLGQKWVGTGFRLASDGKTLVSANKLRQFRPPSYKRNLGKVQSNFESRASPRGPWTNNGHSDLR